MERVSNLVLLDEKHVLIQLFSIASLNNSSTAVSGPSNGQGSASTNTPVSASQSSNQGSKSPKESGNKDKNPQNNASKANASASSAPAAPVEKAPVDMAKFNLIRSVGEECTTEKELEDLLRAKPNSFRLYDGFEPSGRMHIAQGMFKAINVNKCTKSGGRFVFWVADWFALMNDKMGGDLDKIRNVGKYLVEVWKGAGMDMTNVEFRWASDDIVGNAEKYWKKMLDITRRFTVARVTKCCQIMGRKEGSLTAAQLLYALMQCTDIFHLEADICQLGVDQRKVNMLARDYCDAAGIRFKPIILSHHMLYGLKAGQAKMSKSDPDSAIYMEDTAEDVERKIMNAYCPIKPEENQEVNEEESLQIVKDDLKNPCLDYIKFIVMSAENASFQVGDKVYTNFDELKNDFVNGLIPEVELKKNLITSVNKLLQPVRDHFANSKEAADLLELVKSYKKEAATLDATKKAGATGDVKRVQYLFEEDDKKIGFAVENRVVFAPLPQYPIWKLGEVLTVIKQLRSLSESGESKSRVVLFVPDLAALAMGCLADANDKKSDPTALILASFTSLLETIDAIDPTLFKGDSAVKVIWQSKAMLSNPNDFWISVINVGRCFPVSRVREATVDPNASEKVGQTVMSLMHVGSILALHPTIVSTDSTQHPLHVLAQEYYKLAGITAIPMFEIRPIEPVDSRIHQRSTGQEASSFAPSEDDVLIFDNPSNEVKQKVKKAFCEPGNVNDNPVITWVDEIILSFGGKLSISRPAEHGGDVEYTSVDDVREDFKTGKLHPGDLKPTVSKALVDFMTRIENRFKEKAENKKAKDELQKLLKKQQTKQKE